MRARADGVGATLEPGYTHVEGRTTVPGGRTSSTSTDTLSQRYRLTLDRSLTDVLAVGVEAGLTDEHGWTRTDGVWSEARARSTLLGARLTLGGPVLSATAGVDRREQQFLSRDGNSLITESYSANAQWRPLDLPELQLRLAHVDTHDRYRLLRDGTTDSLQFGTRYSAQTWEVRYLLAWGRDQDHLPTHLTESTAVTQTATGNRADNLFGGRTRTYVSATLQTRDASTVVRAAGGTVTQPQVPANGYSAVVALPATPVDVALLPNPQVVDGLTGTATSVNLGWGLAAGGDLNRREVGAGFSNVTTDVNTIYLWVDRRLSPEVGQALAGSVQVYAGDDNQHWTPVALAGAAALSQLDDRIEIPIVQTRARYLKVDLRPLAAGVTTDTTFRDVFVSEVQFLLVLSAAQVPRHDSNFGVSATGMMRTLILPKPNLSYDFSGSVAYQDKPGRTTYDVVNGLSAFDRVWSQVSATARAARRDASNGLAHVGRWEWSAGLAGQPIPTASWSLTYAGNKESDRLLNSVSGFGRADWYEGISSQASAGASITTQGLRLAEAFQSSANTTLAPNRHVTLTAGALYSRTFVSDPDAGDVLTQFARVDGSLSLTPTPAISAAATISRVVLGLTPSTYATVFLNYAPLRGELQLSVAYTKTFDVEARATTAYFTPALRWNVRPGVTVNAYYTAAEISSPVQTTRTRTVGTNLLITL